MIYSKQSVLSKGSSLCLLNNFKAKKTFSYSLQGSVCSAYRQQLQLVLTSSLFYDYLPLPVKATFIEYFIEVNS
jgi:hypothetical protein